MAGGGALARWNAQRKGGRDNQLVALENLNTARTRHRPLHEVTTEDGRISFRTQLKYTRAATTKDAFGRIVPKPADRLFRPMEILNARGKREMRAVYGSRKAALIGQHQSAIERFLTTGDESVLEPFQGKRVAGVELASDPDVIEHAARVGTLEELEPYPRGGR
jgi:hypothetical protein